MIPGPWAGLVLALAVYRLARLAGWDDFPPIIRARGWVTGAELVTNGSTNSRMGLTGEPVTTEWKFRRPLLADLLGCAFCLGFWISVATYLAWRWEPVWTLTGSAPFALSAAVGLIAKNLDP